jgi:hypothetical protein
VFVYRRFEMILYTNSQEERVKYLASNRLVIGSVCIPIPWKYLASNRLVIGSVCIPIPWKYASISCRVVPPEPGKRRRAVGSGSRGTAVEGG